MKINAETLLPAGLAFAAAIGVFMLPPLAQDPGYHGFADSRSLVGIPNFWNLVSNLPFLAVGIAGLLHSATRSAPRIPEELRASYLWFFIGVALTALGSAWYHLAPDNTTLVWDRLPMAVAFMAFVSILIGETLGSREGRSLLYPLLTAGGASVAYWHYTETAGAGDLRPYVLVQFLPMLLLPLLLVAHGRRMRGRNYLWGLLGAYGLAKLLEHFDAAVFEALGWISGHSLKHLIAALGAWMLLLSMKQESPIRKIFYGGQRMPDS